ncbi:MAG: hypothetical protein HY329_20660 [Chloroflexi bacterium]|nr:hypothetical protein [Chloroflexota bacterium]
MRPQDDQRAVLTFNIGDFSALHIQWLSDGRQHSGIILPRQLSEIGELVRRLSRHLELYTAANDHNL